MCPNRDNMSQKLPVHVIKNTQFDIKCSWCPNENNDKPCGHKEICIYPYLLKHIAKNCEIVIIRNTIYIVFNLTAVQCIATITHL